MAMSYKGRSEGSSRTYVMGTGLGARIVWTVLFVSVGRLEFGGWSSLPLGGLLR